MFLDFLIVIVIGFFIGWHTSKAWQIWAFKRLLEDLKVTNEDLQRVAREQGLIDQSQVELDLPVVEIRIEQHPEGLFAYRKSDSQYLGQGRDREELMQNLVNNLTNVRVIVAKEDGAELINPQNT